MSSPNFALSRLFLTLTISFFTAFISEPTAAVPVQGTSLFSISPRDLPPISHKFFQDMLYKIDRDTCVFYYKLGTEAQAWARKKTPSLKTIWWAYDPKAYETDRSPLKDYYEANEEVKYWELMCEVYTRACGGESWVLIKPEDPDEPDNSIWTRVEYATIKKQESGIVKVDRVDEKGGNPRTIWTKPETGTALQAGQNGKKLPLMVEGIMNGPPGLPTGGKNAEPPSPMGGQPSMYQNGPPGGS